MDIVSSSYIFEWTGLFKSCMASDAKISHSLLIARCSGYLFSSHDGAYVAVDI